MSRLTLADRVAIECGIYEGLKLNEIAKKIKRSPNTVSKEIKTNRTIAKGDHFLGKDCKMASGCKKCICAGTICATKGV